MKCEICGQGPLGVNSVTVYRVNPKGVKGIWRCLVHLTPEQRTAIDHDVQGIVQAIEEDNRRKDER